jgi:hypothetical protein
MLGIRGWRGLKTENRAENGKQVLKTGLPSAAPALALGSLYPMLCRYMPYDLCFISVLGMMA